MPTLAEQMRKYISIVEDAVWNENRDLTYCYIDISTATSAGETNIRIFPKEGRNKFFKNAVRDVRAKSGDLYKIIDEATSAKPIDKIRIIISREYSDSIKQLTRYVRCDKDRSEIVDEILNNISELAYLIKFHDVEEDPGLFSVIKDFHNDHPNSNLDGLEKFLKTRCNNCDFSSDNSKLEIEKDGKNFLLSDERWKNIIGVNIDVTMSQARNFS